MYNIDNYIIKEFKVKNIPQNRYLCEYARRNRHKGCISEVVFWTQVHKKNFMELISIDNI